MLLSFLDYFPKLIRQLIPSLVKLVLGLIIFSEIGVKVTEFIEFLDKLVKLFLFVVGSMKETQESLLNLREVLNDPLSLASSQREDLFHLSLVIGTQLLPMLHQSGLKVTVKVTFPRFSQADSLSCRLRLSDLALILLAILHELSSLFLSSLSQLFLFLSFPNQLCLFFLLKHNLRQDSLLDESFISLLLGNDVV